MQAQSSSTVVSVYRFQDIEGALLYVGITASGQRRFRKHAVEKDWWPLVTTIQVEHYQTAEEAVEREREIIQSEHPRFNRQQWRIEIGPDELSVDDVARLVGLGRGTVVEMIRAGTFPARVEMRGGNRQYAVPRSFFRRPLAERTNLRTLLLVCGSRDWTDQDAIADVLADYAPERVTVLHGACRGADRLAAGIADLYGFEVEPFPAKWRVNGVYNPKAGFERNVRMLEEGKPDLVIAFQRNGSRGTQHTIDEARKRGIPTKVVTA